MFRESDCWRSVMFVEQKESACVKAASKKMAGNGEMREGEIGQQGSGAGKSDLCAACFGGFWSAWAPRRSDVQRVVSATFFHNPHTLSPSVQAGDEYE